ncbi:endonuclease/exonuclease/phosphatase [Pseudomonas aeruginosa]|uniref:endonuclease/exonuclease/phosphatase family protein n=2 Tax=Pseudomonas TaxID=286 RepID=UPI00071C1B70|nr:MULTISPECIES: endonuclease/exonuclease/phosphatase family protein [Pseudomonas aeruginosa group]KSC49924.1 endonuclease/exonuclease/phosphatase [Pseudomonas paraeruginosa]KSL14507.1 endonuclease/exonuclease/phosphatase [Pseudomonas aeruginosa]MBH8715845.1 endonuclease/exonuclease/phosphatase family protein [Pseudomonas aeruginosa]MBH9344187.1 endonuclease/exonuclease/phosphatase family protein [Pseudomonas aeruginosa]MBH9394709.1 endonuclease/exonuclease/phosphatase family protein [Pseudomo
MPLKIMIWNAQHFDNQKYFRSQAYTDKLDFLRHYLTQEEIDIIALMETGKTGDINQTLIDDLSSEYTFIGATSQESGARKNTTLGTMIFLKNIISTKFSLIDNYILSPTEQRGAVIIKHNKTHLGFAFYHSNSSYRAMANIVDTVQYIQLNLSSLGISKLCYFGGDLNTDGNYESKEISSRKNLSNKNNPYARVFQVAGPSLYKLLPTGSGYTHASIKEVFVPDAKSRRLLKSAEQQKKQPRVSLKRTVPKTLVLTGKVTGYTTTFRLLDFAYVDDLGAWSATCDASLSAPGGLIRPIRMSKGKAMRSDHYPVVFTHNGNFD